MPPCQRISHCSPSGRQGALLGLFTPPQASARIGPVTDRRRMAGSQRAGSVWVLTLALLVALADSCATGAGSGPWAEPSALPLQPGLPDPLKMLDGRRVASREEWFGQ